MQFLWHSQEHLLDHDEMLSLPCYQSDGAYRSTSGSGRSWTRTSRLVARVRAT